MGFSSISRVGVAGAWCCWCLLVNDWQAHFQTGFHIGIGISICVFGTMRSLTTHTRGGAFIRLFGTSIKSRRNWPVNLRLAFFY